MYIYIFFLSAIFNCRHRLSSLHCMNSYSVHLWNNFVEYYSSFALCYNYSREKNYWHIKMQKVLIVWSSLILYHDYCFTMDLLPLFLWPVYSDGRVCISILHAPGDDPMGYETSAERWSPVQSVEKILLSVVSMLAGEIRWCKECSGDWGNIMPTNVSWPWPYEILPWLIVIFEETDKTRVARCVVALLWQMRCIRGAVLLLCKA